MKAGSTTFEVHIHPEWPCDKCRITGSNLIQTNAENNLSSDQYQRGALVQSEDQAGNVAFQDTRICLEKERIEELKRLRKRLLNDEKSKKQKKHSDKKAQSTYVDRAAMRRLLYKDNGNEKQRILESGEREDSYDEYGQTDNAVTTGSKTNNALFDNYDSNPVGYDSISSLVDSTAGKILKKMGWTEGQGLGVSGNATAEPIPILTRVGRPCLGSSQLGGPPASSTPQFVEQTESIVEITKRRARERFFNISKN